MYPFVGLSLPALATMIRDVSGRKEAFPLQTSPPKIEQETNRVVGGRKVVDTPGDLIAGWLEGRSALDTQPAMFVRRDDQAGRN